MVSPPKKLASRSLAAKPTAMPPMPPSVSTPAMLTPSVCRHSSSADTTTTSRPSLLSASTVVRSISSPRTSREATMFSLTRPMKRSRNQPRQRTMPMLRNGTTYSRKGSSTWRRRMSTASDSPMSQITTSVGRLAQPTSASSQTLTVRTVTRRTWRSRNSASRLAAAVTARMMTMRVIQGSARKPRPTRWTNSVMDCSGKTLK